MAGPAARSYLGGLVVVGNVAVGPIAVGNVACGFLAIGNVSVGLVSVGLAASAGVLTASVNALGVVAAGVNVIATAGYGVANALVSVGGAGANVATTPGVGLVIASVCIMAWWGGGGGKMLLRLGRRDGPMSLARFLSSNLERGVVRAKLVASVEPGFVLRGPSGPVAVHADAALAADAARALVIARRATVDATLERVTERIVEPDGYRRASAQEETRLVCTSLAVVERRVERHLVHVFLVAAALSVWIVAHGYESW